MLVCRPQHKALTSLLASFSSVKSTLRRDSRPVAELTGPMPHSSLFSQGLRALPSSPGMRSPMLPALQKAKRSHRRISNLLSTTGLAEPATPSSSADTVPPPCLPRSMGVRSSPAPPAIPLSPAGQLQGRQHVRKTTFKTHPVHASGHFMPCCARSQGMGAAPTPAPAAMASP